MIKEYLDVYTEEVEEGKGDIEMKDQLNMKWYRESVESAYDESRKRDGDKRVSVPE